jgi:ABC-type thiamin/hydroxymethylpyrimidine transport system permease subunit
MISEDYKPTTFWKFLLDRAKIHLIRTLFGLIITILSIIYTQDVFTNGYKFEKYLLVGGYIVLISSTILSIFLPYTIFKKLKKK